MENELRLMDGPVSIDGPGSRSMTASATFLEGVNELRESLESDDAFAAWYGRTAPRVRAYLITRAVDIDSPGMLGFDWRAGD